jgi:hypothetical protein
MRPTSCWKIFCFEGECAARYLRQSPPSARRLEAIHGQDLEAERLLALDLMEMRVAPYAPSSSFRQAGSSALG